MKVKYQDKIEDFRYDGRIVIYKKFIKHSTNTNFVDLMKKIISSHKLNATEVMANSISLWYKKNEEEIIITENAIADKVRLSQTKIESFTLIQKAAF